MIAKRLRTECLRQSLIFDVMLVQFAAKLSEMKYFAKYFLNFTGCAALRCPFHLPQPGLSEDF